MEGTKALAKAFMSGLLPALTELYLGYNNTSWRPFSPIEDGLVELARVLKNEQLPKLQILDLKHNAGSSKEVAEAFKNALRFNKTLLALKIDWPNFGLYEISVAKILERNRKIASVVHQLGREDVQATNGKIFICGNPREGKTTLGRSLQKHLPPYVTYFLRERKVRKTPSTRGIEVSRISSKVERSEEKIKLAIWDLAGQPEYQVLHSAFLPDLAFADGEATTFVIVCNASHPRSDTGISHRGQQVLLRWMRFIASSSFKGEQKGKRHVLLVLNRFNNEPCKYLDEWQEYLIDLKERFHEYLEIYERPFLVDARVAREVRIVKEHLIQHTRQKLESKKVPKLCQQIQDTILESSKRRDALNFPVIPWAKFAAMFQSLLSDQQRLKAAAAYLHESGGLIHFREGWDDPISRVLSRPLGQSLVVLDPDWFCREVVGYLLLPDKTSMLAKNEVPLTRQVRPDGSVALDSLQRYLRHILHDRQKVCDIVAILVRLGICYMAGTDKVFIPALIPENLFEGNHSSTGVYNAKSGTLGLGLGPTDQWVMGYCLKVQYRATTLLPIAVFRRLQVELAQDPMCTAADSQYMAGYFNITFKTNGMGVLVEFSAHDNDPNLDDRVDILVKPLVSREQDCVNEKEERRQLQVDLAQLILEKFVSLAETWSPGVEFIRLVVTPWCTAKGTVKTEDRIVTLSIEDAKRRVEAGETTTSWTVDGEFVYLTSLLSGQELRDLQNSVEKSCEMFGKLMAELENHPTEHPGEIHDKSLRNQEDDPIRRQLNRIEAKIDEGFAHVGKDLAIVLDRQKDLLKRAQALRRFTKEQVTNSVPRFMYMTRARDSSMWMSLKDIFVEKANLHFLCESHFDGHSLHEVLGQEGVEIKNLRKFASKVLPWLEWSLKVAVVVGKVASNALLPGLGQLINTFPAGYVQDAANISSSVAYGVSAALLAIPEGLKFPNQTADTSSLPTTSGPLATPLRPMDVNCNDCGLKEILTELIGELKPTEFQSKFQLKRAVVNNSGYVVWICNDCFHKYHAQGAVEQL